MVGFNADEVRPQNAVFVHVIYEFLVRYRSQHALDALRKQQYENLDTVFSCIFSAVETLTERGA